MAEKKGSQGTGLEPNVAGLLCYVLGWVSGIVFLVLEKDKFVRFHAVQSIIVFGTFSVANGVLWSLTWIPWVGILFIILGSLVGIFAFILWIVLMLKAYNGVKYKMPIAGDIAERNS
ncbi:MAG: DUF4870 domain-containing protein [Dehalococcoidia bacterium]|jgi:uncharacterized membrane protein